MKNQYAGEAMETKTEMLVAVLNNRMKNMGDDDRLELMRLLANGYCKACGCEDPDGRCQCQNDE